MYLNQIFYGQRSYGIEAAAQTFFNKHAGELNLAEASLLAGLPQAPSFYDPTINLDQAKKRQRYVLDQMVKYHYITNDEADAAWNTPLQPQTRTSEVQGAPHFTQYVKDYVREKYGDDAFLKGGLQIWTTIDLDLQAQAEEIVQENMPMLNAYRRNNAAMVVLVPHTGEILSMVGSADFNDPTIGGQINYALALLQPGSSIKPVVYAAAFESGWNPATVIMDDSLKVEPPGAPEPYYEPHNYTGQSYGAVPHPHRAFQLVEYSRGQGHPVCRGRPCLRFGPAHGRQDRIPGITGELRSLLRPWFRRIAPARAHQCLRHPGKPG